MPDPQQMVLGCSFAPAAGRPRKEKLGKKAGTDPR